MKDKQIVLLKRKSVIHYCERKYLIRQHPRSHICLYFALNGEIEMKEGKFWGCAAPVGKIRYWRRAAKPADNGLQTELFFVETF